MRKIIMETELESIYLQTRNIFWVHDLNHLPDDIQIKID